MTQQPHQSPLLGSIHSSNTNAPISIPNSAAAQYHHQLARNASAASRSNILSSSLNNHLHLTSPTPTSPLDNLYNSSSLPLRSISDRLPSPDAQLAERYGQISLENSPSYRAMSPVLSATPSARSQRPHLTLVTSASSPRSRSQIDDLVPGVFPRSISTDSREGTRNAPSNRHTDSEPRNFAPALAEDYHRLPPWNGGDRAGDGRRSSLVDRHQQFHSNGNGNLGNNIHYAPSSPGSSSSPGLSPTPTTSSASAPSPIEAMELPPSLGATSFASRGPVPVRSFGYSERERSREHHHAHRPYPSLPSVSAHSNSKRRDRDLQIATESLTPYGLLGPKAYGAGGSYGPLLSPYATEHQESVAFEKDGKASMVIDGRAGIGSTLSTPVTVGAASGIGMIGTPSRSRVDEQQLHRLSMGWNNFFSKAH